MFDNYVKNSSHHSDISRRILLKRIACFISGISVFPHLTLASAEADKDATVLSGKELETFESFIEVVIPSSKKYSKFLAVELRDEFYGFNKYFKFLLKCLNERADATFSSRFSQLSDDKKTQIIHEGTRNGLLKKQVFNGAIYLLQLIVFSGLCEGDQSCEIIDFPGASRGVFETYPESGLENVQSVTLKGNPN